MPNFSFRSDVQPKNRDWIRFDWSTHSNDDGDAVQTLHNTCVTVNTSDCRTAIASWVIRPTSPTTTVAPTWSLITTPAWPDQSVRRHYVASNYVVVYRIIIKLLSNFTRAGNGDYPAKSYFIIVRSKTALITVNSQRPSQLESVGNLDNDVTVTACSDDTYVLYFLHKRRRRHAMPLRVVTTCSLSVGCEQVSFVPCRKILNTMSTLSARTLKPDSIIRVDVPCMPPIVFHKCFRGPLCLIDVIIPFYLHFQSCFIGSIIYILWL